METIKFLFALLLIVSSCSDEKRENENLDIFKEKSINYESTFDNPIGFIDSKSKDFIKITKNDLVSHWNKVYDLKTKTEFENIKLIKAEVDAEEEQYYILNSTSENGMINISSKVFLTEVGFRLAGETCKCESTNCTFGCEVLRMCVCSSCGGQNGQCKKTHTLTTKLTIAAF